MSYTFEQDKPKLLEDAVGEWVPISEFGDDGWSLTNIIPKNLYLIGIFIKEEHIESTISPVYTTISNTYSGPAVITVLDMKKNPDVSIIELDFITINKPPTTKIVEEEIKLPSITSTIPVDLKLECIITNTNPPFCRICGSSTKRKWWKSTFMCINPSCPNYWNKK